MFKSLTALSLLALAVAQDSGDQSSSGSATTEQVAVVEANFENAKLVPDLLSTFTPQGVLNVEFDGSAIEVGQNLSQDSVQTQPSLSISPAENATEISGNNKFTVILADADVVGTDEATKPQTRHWLVNGATLETTSTPWSINYNQSTSITDYAGPAPPEGSGPHRYVFMVFLEPDSFQPPENLSTAGQPVGTFFVEAYAQSSGLGDVVAANYMQVENGSPTADIPATTAVDTATIGAGSQTSGASQSGGSGASGTSKPSAASGSGAAPSSSGSGAAGQAMNLGYSAIVGGLGVVGAVLGAAMIV